MKNKKALFTLFAVSSATILVSVLALNSSPSFKKAFSVSNETFGHYDRLDPTLTNPGCQEFWISCETHEVFFEAPTGGETVIERGQPTVSMVESWKDLGDGRYIPAWQIDSTHFQFGEYPQEKVTDADLITELTAKIANSNPTAASHEGWTIYDYYASGSPISTNFYQDFRFGAYRYRVIMIRGYRPNSTTTTSTVGNSYVDDNGFNKDTLYFFKYSPINWRLLVDGGTTYKLLSTSLLDATQYYHSKTNTETPTGYANHYGSSEMRSFLNGSFHDLAFTTFEKSKLETMDVNNSNNTPAVDSANTSDKVTLLSYAEARSTAYGFVANNNATDSRVFPGTDYAKSQGQYNDYAYLRTAAAAATTGEKCYAIKDGGAIESNLITFTRYGIAPVITINIE